MEVTWKLQYFINIVDDTNVPEELFLALPLVPRKQSNKMVTLSLGLFCKASLRVFTYVLLFRTTNVQDLLHIFHFPSKEKLIESSPLQKIFQAKLLSKEIVKPLSYQSKRKGCLRNGFWKNQQEKQVPRILVLHKFYFFVDFENLFQIFGLRNILPVTDAHEPF